eukprot:CAMPEP_0180530204 /NCGR_PEP_ID=MMETSP1036_2-20121128/61794_1 /TAXON_ID=632150 /ORGANISM="Azadinium spinosum, Strain 3D9" /LENGTH=35 /DNA_ID= /DNA_START= /DNA_END= /DNA_ORIENTATION=
MVTGGVVANATAKAALAPDKAEDDLQEADVPSGQL